MNTSNYKYDSDEYVLYKLKTYYVLLQFWRYLQTIEKVEVASGFSPMSELIKWEEELLKISKLKSLTEETKATPIFKEILNSIYKGSFLIVVKLFDSHLMIFEIYTGLHSVCFTLSFEETPWWYNDTMVSYGGRKEWEIYYDEIADQQDPLQNFKDFYHKNVKLEIIERLRNVMNIQ
jgi:hypothetical protein